ncbi:MAG: endonuclease/exonuclease/phosphatase family protein [Planctomycetaceae bacterium]
MIPTLIRSVTTAAVVLIAAMFGSVSTSLADEPSVLRVLCYNIHYGQGNDGVYDLQRLADVIKDAKPDLVALQEVDVGVERSGRVHEARRLGELTGMAVRFGPTQHYQGGLFGNAVLSKLPILDVHIQPLPYTEATEERVTYPRGAIAVKVRAQSGSEILFISTHFQHNLEEDRVAEATAVNEFFANHPQATILAGDMNAVPGSEPINILEQKWTNAIDASAAPSAPSDKPRSRIDYIFHRGPGLRMVSSQVIAEAMASDHRPVLAVFADDVRN